ncbi:MAG: acetoacetate decarboxylase family protein [Candidatus Hodarchaeota archaeon]
MSFVKDVEEIKKKRELLLKSEFTGVNMFSVLWETKPEIVKRILPPPLEPAEFPLATAFIATYEKTNQGLPYSESDLFLRVKYKEEYGNYHLAMHVTDDRAMIGGREICGFPKKMANIELNIDGDEVHAFAERAGTRYIEIKAKFGGGFNEPDICAREVAKLLPSKKKPTVNFNFKYFPNASKTGFAFKPRLVRQTTQIRLSNFKMGKAELKLASSDHDPWGEIEVVKVLGALFIESNNTMDPGEVMEEVDPEEFLPYSYQQQDWY